MEVINIKATTLSDAWFQTLYSVIENGREFIIDKGSFEGQKRLEFDYITVQITQPWVKPLLPQLPEGSTIPNPVEDEYLDAYLPYLMTGEEKEGEAYTYGQRICREWVRSMLFNKYGDIINFRGVYGKSSIVPFTGQWRAEKKYSGGGILLDQGIHMVDLMRLFAGEFVDVHSYVSNDFWGFDVEDNAYALMCSQSGIVGMLHSSATQWRHRFSLDINLDKGSINLGGILSGSKSYGAETMTVVWANPDDDEGDPREQMTRYNKDTSWANEIAVFSNAIKTGKSIKYGGSMDALLTMQLVYDIYKADKTWKNKWNIE